MYIRHEIGKIGENIACKYLQSIGYKIIEKNFESRQGEIDIIAIDKNEIVFIEVKTRTSKRYGTPIEAVNKNKQKHLMKTIKYYIYVKHLENKFIRIDVIEIFLSKNKYKLNHVKQIV